MKSILNERIIKNFKSKQKFSKYLKIDQRDLSRKLQTVENKVHWLNTFLNHLDLELIIKEKN